MDLMCTFLPGDPRLVEQIVKELKSQGIFDQFRKECISDVDTKPAYQNLRQRVEGSVTGFLNEQTWSPDMNKNQVREMVRKHIHESGFLETGVERIVDQVVNPKINTVFIPKVDEVMYKFLGIERPKEKTSTSLEINTAQDLLPNDLEAVSPELPEEKVFPKEEIKETKDEEMSPSIENNDKIIQEENSVDSQSSILSAVVSHDSNNSMRQDSVMSLNSSESRMSLPENNLKLELEDICLSQKSSDSNSKTEMLGDEKTESNIENKEEMKNPLETFSEKSSEESKCKSKDRRREKHHSSSDRSKSRNDKERDKSKSDKPKTEEKDGKTEEKKYKIPKLTDKSKDSKSKDKEDKHKSDKGKSDHKSDKDKKYDKDRKSKHSSEKDSSSSDRRKKDKTEKKDKDDKRDRKESSRSDKSRDDKRSSSSKKRDSQSSKDSQREKDKEGHIKSSKEETSDKSKNGHSSSSSKKDSKSRKDDDKHKSSHKKDEKDERKRKRRSKDDHQSSKEKRSGGRSSDRDSDGPSSSKKPHVSPQTSSGDYSTQQTSQDSSTLNSEGSSGYSGNSDKSEEQHEEVSYNALMEMQKIKVPKFASNLNEAMKIMKIRKLIKKFDNVIKADPQNPEVQNIMGEIENLTKDIKREKQEQKEPGEENEETDENQKTQALKSRTVNIDEFISSSNISMAKWNALEAKFMEQITDVDYNSYESPYMDEEEASFELRDEKNQLEREEIVVSEDFESEKSLIYEMAEAEEKASNDNSDNLEGNLYFSVNNMISNKTQKEEDLNVDSQDQNTSNHSFITAHISEQSDVLKSTNSQAIENDEEIESKDVGINDMNPRNFKDFKQRAIVLLRKHALTEEMIKNKENSECKEHPITVTTNVEISVDNMKDNIKDTQLPENSRNNEEISDVLDKEETISKEHSENNLIVEETISQDIDIYSLGNSCEVCLDSKGDVCKGLERSNNRSLNFINCIINILENEISRVKETNIKFFSTKQDNYDYQTRKRKVIEWKTDVSNNNFENSASKRLEVEDTKFNSKNLSSPKKIHPDTNSKTTTKFDDLEKEHLKQTNLGIQTSEIKSGRQSSVSFNTPESVENQINTKTDRPADKSTEKKIRASQRYSSEDLYKPRIFLRRSGRDLKNP